MQLPKVELITKSDKNARKTAYYLTVSNKWITNAETLLVIQLVEFCKKSHI